MTVPEIISALTPYTGKFPKDAVRAAVEQREAITPELLRALEDFGADMTGFAKREDYMLHLFAMYLLAEFREKPAFPLITKIISGPPTVVDELIGDTVTEGLSSILGSTYNGDLESLVKIALQQDAYPFVRSTVQDTITLLFHEKFISRDQMVGSFRRILTELTADDDPQAWNGVVMAAAEAQASELLPEIRTAFDRGMVERGYCDLEDVIKILNEPPHVLLEGFSYHHHLVNSAEEEMSWWAAFSEDDSPPSAKRPYFPQLESSEDLDPYTADKGQTYTRVGPKIGRNDPCRCGSGKKYKKCCGAN